MAKPCRKRISNKLADIAEGTSRLNTASYPGQVKAKRRNEETIPQKPCERVFVVPPLALTRYQYHIRLCIMYVRPRGTAPMVAMLSDTERLQLRLGGGGGGRPRSLAPACKPKKHTPCHQHHNTTNTTNNAIRAQQTLPLPLPIIRQNCTYVCVFGKEYLALE